MSKDNIELIIAVIGSLIGIGGATAAIFAKWRASIEKGYAAQRDFQHLRRNQEQIVQGIDQIAKDIDARLDRVDLALNRVESMMHNSLLRSHPLRRHEEDDDKLH